MRRRGFTLIELLVVVAIMALVVGLLVPMAIGLHRRATAPEARPDTLAQAPLSVGAPADEGEAPRVRATRVTVALDAAPVLEGSAVHTRYVASFVGRFEVEPRAPHLDITFPFPPGVTELRDASLLLSTPAGAPREPDGVRYDLRAIRWSGAVTPGEPVIAEVRYRAVGRDTFAYDVASGARTGTLAVDITLSGGALARVSPESLEPTSTAPGALSWHVENLIAERPIAVELPAGASPLGQLVTLLRFAALAVLLLGAGFWYLSEEQRPGRLDTFRFAHFLLLALDYSLFFAVFGVAMFWLPWPGAAALAAVVSLPLFVLHVARITDRAFAVTRGLPLALSTLAVVLAAVFRAEQRPLVLLAATVAALAYVTLTYRRWSDGRVRARDARQEARIAAHEATQRTAAARALEGELAGARAAARALGRAAIDRAESPLERAELEGQARRLERRVEGAAALCASGERAALEDERAALAAQVAEAHAAERRARAATAAAQQALGAALARLDAARARARPLLEDGEGDEGPRAALRTAIDRAVALEARVTDGAPSALASDAERVTALIEAHLAQIGAARQAHCVVCGAAGDPGAPHCARCGEARPHHLRCVSCGWSLRVPAQLVRRRWGEVALCCERCGARAVASGAAGPQAPGAPPAPIGGTSTAPGAAGGSPSG